MPQRKADVFMAMVETWAEDADAATAPRTRGLASLVVALSAKDLTTLPTTSDDADSGAVSLNAKDASATGTTGHSSSGAVDSAPVAPPTAESLNAPSVWFPTNTNARLHPIDILPLGLAEHDLGVVIDPVSGRVGWREARHAHESLPDLPGAPHQPPRGKDQAPF